MDSTEHGQRSYRMQRTRLESHDLSTCARSPLNVHVECGGKSRGSPRLAVLLVERLY